MRVLVLSIEYPPLGGGASPMIHAISKQYVQKGHEVTVITMLFEGLPSHEIKDGVEIFRIKCLRSSKHISHFWEHISFILSARNFLRTLLKQHDFDFCHAHFLVPTGLIAQWLKRKYQIPYVITAQGSDVPGYNPDRFHFLHLFTPPLIRSIVDDSTNIVAPSQYLKSLIQQSIGDQPEKLLFIPSGIDPDHFIPGEKKPILLSTGRLLPRKGFQYLIEAVSTERFPFEVHICGDGPMMKELKEQAKKSLTPIVFHGWIDNKSEKYLDLLSTASIFCLVSSRENASTSLMEALSAGCGVITSTVSGCPETVGEAGICVPPADVPALRLQLKYLIENPEITQQLMIDGRKRAIREFSWITIAQKYLDLFQQHL